MKFNLNDIITGKESSDAHYSFTTSDAIMKVINFGISEIEVLILEHKYNKYCIGETYYVDPDLFRKVTQIKIYKI